MSLIFFLIILIIDLIKPLTKRTGNFFINKRFPMEQGVVKMEEEDIKQKIFEKFNALSIKMGFKKVTVEMLAKECGISKKTIYRHFKSKDEIIQTYATNIIQHINYEFVRIQKDYSDPKEILYKFFDIIFQIISNIPEDTIMQDARKFYPDIENKIIFLREEYSKIFLKTIKRGIKEGVFKNINPHFIEGMYLGSVNYIFSPTFMSQKKLSVKETITSFKIMLFSGLLNENSVY